MKNILSLLMAFVFLQTQCWALFGGPVYQGSSLGSEAVGTYAGVMVPKTVNRLFENPSFVGKSNDLNTLGLFLVGIPATGAGTGTFLFFQDGEAFYGAFTALVDPVTGKFNGLLTGAAATNNSETGGEFFSPVSAVGKIEALVVKGPTVTAAKRLQGIAFIQLQGFVPDSSPSGSGFGTLREITFTVDGWKQSSEVKDTTLPIPQTASLPAPPTTIIP